MPGEPQQLSSHMRDRALPAQAAFRSTWPGAADGPYSSHTFAWPWPWEQGSSQEALSAATVLWHAHKMLVHIQLRRQHEHASHNHALMQTLTAGGRKVVEVGGQRVLIAEAEGQIYAVSNKCSHLGLPLVGKTALLQGKVSRGALLGVLVWLTG